MNIPGSRIVVTGGASGLGQKMARSLSSAGAHVGILDCNPNALDAFKTQCPSAFAIQCDITDSVQVEEGVNELAEKLCGVDVAINNAGLLYSAPLLGFGPGGFALHSIEAWHRVMKLNLDAVFYVTRCVSRMMVKSRTKGLILNISSVVAKGNMGQGAYSASKAAVESLTVTWAKELGPWGIRVAALAPGFTDSPSTHAAVSEECIKEVVSESPLKRLGTQDEIAHAVHFIIENDFISGTTVQVDGGLRI